MQSGKSFLICLAAEVWKVQNVLPCLPLDTFHMLLMDDGLR